MNRKKESLPPHFRHNFIAILVDYVSFGVAFSFADPGTVMPSFVAQLTSSEPIIGLVGTVWVMGWLMPQLAGAAIMSGRAKKPVMMLAVYLARPLILLMGLAMWSSLPRYPAAMLAVFFTLLGSFALLDGISSVAWFDLLAQTIPVTRRGRLLGTAQLTSALLGVGVGVIVEGIVASPVLPFPHNYALLFTIGGLAHIPSVIALGLIREPEGEIDAQDTPRPSLREVLNQLRDVWREDPDFRRLMATRWLTGLMDLSTTFYVLHAANVFGILQGRLLAARMVGGIVSSLTLGWLSERHGPRPVIWLGSVTSLASPLLALVVHLVRPATPFYAGLVYFLVYFLLGVTTSSRMLGNTNYLMELAPEGRRPLYIGLANTLAGLLVPASLLGGFLLRATSYTVLFGTTAVCVAGGIVTSLRLRNVVEEETREAEG